MSDFFKNRIYCILTGVTVTNWRIELLRINGSFEFNVGQSETPKRIAIWLRCPIRFRYFILMGRAIEWRYLFLQSYSCLSFGMAYLSYERRKHWKMRRTWNVEENFDQMNYFLIFCTVNLPGKTKKKMFSFQNRKCFLLCFDSFRVDFNNERNSIK